MYHQVKVIQALSEHILMHMYYAVSSMGIFREFSKWDRKLNSGKGLGDSSASTCLSLSTKLQKEGYIK